jgi:hypothetical protein
MLFRKKSGELKHFHSARVFDKRGYRQLVLLLECVEDQLDSWL